MGISNDPIFVSFLIFLNQLFTVLHAFNFLFFLTARISTIFKVFWWHWNETPGMYEIWNTDNYKLDRMNDFIAKMPSIVYFEWLGTSFTSVSPDDLTLYLWSRNYSTQMNIRVLKVIQIELNKHKSIHVSIWIIWKIMD